MTTFTFNPTDGGEFDGSNNAPLENHTGSGATMEQGTSDNDATIIIFNSNAIRTALAGYNITGCHISFYVDAISGTTPIYTYFGTHNYTSVPSTYQTSRVNPQRVRYNSFGAGQVTNLDLGTTIGAELRDGVSTGILLGPVPSGVNPTDNTIELRAQDSPNHMVLTIDAVLANAAPNAPTLNTPAAGSVVDGTANIGFNWTHSDPQGDAMAAFYFRRNKGSGVFDYWNGTNFVSTETRLTTSTAPLPAGIMTIPGGKWANGQSYSWSVATEDPSGLKGPYATDRVLYTSLPSVTVVTAPANNATVTTSRPTVTWTFTDTDGPAQYGWAAQIVPASVYNDPGFNPDNYLGTAWSASGTGTTTSATINKDLLNHTTYRAYVKTSSSPNPSGGLQWSGWSFSTFSVVIAPFAPAIVSPQNGSIADLATTGFTLSWQDTYFSNIGSQTAYAIRRLWTGSGAPTGYQWYNGGGWGYAETFLPGNTPAFTFRSGEVANGQTYTFNVAIRDDYSQVSPYSAGSTVTAATVGQVTVIAPSGVTVTSRPTVSWTMFQAENDPQQTYQIKILNASDVVFPTIGAFDPTTVTPVWDSGEVTDALTRNVPVGIDLSNNTSLYVFVRVKTGGLYASWAYQPFNIFLVPPGTPAVTTVANNDMGWIEVTVQGRDSMLSDVASRNADGWMEMAAPNPGNAIVTNGIFFASAQSHLATEAAARAPGNMMVHAMDEYPVQAGFTYTGAVTLIAPVGVSPVAAYSVIHWIDGTDTIISSSYGQSFADQAAIRSVVSAVAPPGAVNAKLGVQWQNVPNTGDRHRFFDPVLRPGSGGEWSPGGLLTNTTVSVSEILSGRDLRFSDGIPVPIATQQIMVIDEEAPIGVPVQYQASTRATYPNATLASLPSLSAVTSWSSGFLWISDPIRPGSGRVFNPQSFAKTTNPIRQGLFRPLGRPDALLVTGVRGLREGTFTIVTYSRAERDAFDDLVAKSEILLMRMPPDQYDTTGDAIYVRPMSDAPQDRPLQDRTQHRTIQMSWVEQYRPLTFLDYSGGSSGSAPAPMNM